MTRRPLPLPTVCSLALALAAGSALAQSGDSAVAEALFRDGRSLLEQNKLDEACPKLAESARLERRVGTLLTLAICREREGKTATAWALYADVVSLARRENRAEREKTARERMSAIEPGLSRLTIVVPELLRATPGLDVRRDGETVGAGAWGVAVPLDPGAHLVTVAATGKTSWTANVTLAATGDRRVVELPPRLDDVPPLPVAPPPPPPPAASSPALASPPPPLESPPPPPPDRGDRTAGYVVGGAGAAALVVGVVFALRTASKQHAARSVCPADTCTDAAGVQANEDARAAYPIAMVGLGLGIAGLATGAVLLLTARDARPTSPGPTASVGPQGASVGWVGAW